MCFAILRERLLVLEARTICARQFATCREVEKQTLQGNWNTVLTLSRATRRGLEQYAFDRHAYSWGLESALRKPSGINKYLVGPPLPPPDLHQRYIENLPPEDGWRCLCACGYPHFYNGLGDGVFYLSFNWAYPKVSALTMPRSEECHFIWWHSQIRNAYTNTPFIAGKLQRAALKKEAEEKAEEAARKHPRESDETSSEE